MISQCGYRSCAGGGSFDQSENYLDRTGAVFITDAPPSFRSCMHGTILRYAQLVIVILFVTEL